MHQIENIESSLRSVSLQFAIPPHPSPRFDEIGNCNTTTNNGLPYSALVLTCRHMTTTLFIIRRTPNTKTWRGTTVSEVLVRMPYITRRVFVLPIVLPSLLIHPRSTRSSSSKPLPINLLPTHFLTYKLLQSAMHLEVGTTRQLVAYRSHRISLQLISRVASHPHS